MRRRGRRQRLDVRKTEKFPGGNVVPCSRTRTLLSSLLLSVQLAALLSPMAEAQPALSDVPDCGSILQQGSESYAMGRFEACIRALRGLVAQSRCATAELAQAHELIARCYVQEGNSNAALSEFNALLCLSPTWEPDTERVNPEQMTLFRTARAQNPCVRQVLERSQAPTPTIQTGSTTPSDRAWWRRRWKWIAGGTVVGVAAVLLWPHHPQQLAPLPDPTAPPPHP